MNISEFFQKRKSKSLLNQIKYVKILTKKYHQITILQFNSISHWQLNSNSKTIRNLTENFQKIPLKLPIMIVLFIPIFLC